MDSTNNNKREINSVSKKYLVQAYTENYVLLEHIIDAPTNPKAIFLFCRLFPNANIKTVRCRLLKKGFTNQQRIDFKSEGDE